MKKNIWIITALICLFVISTQAYAGNKEKSVEFVKKAVAYIKANGEAAFIDGVNNKDMFHQGEWYVWAVKTNYTDNAQTVAHISKAARGNQNAINVKDAKGKLFLKEIVTQAQSKGKGFIEYSWTHPITKKITPKVTYFEKVGDLVVMCGYYK